MAGESVEIVGGGIAGLLAGVVFARAGWKVRLHERSPEIREIGAGILLKHNSISLYEQLGIEGAVLGRGLQLPYRELRDRDGAAVLRSPLAGPTREMIVRRHDLVSGLARCAQAAGVEILTGSEVLAADPDGTLRTADGTVATADLIVVADGFGSRLRDQLGLTRTAVGLRAGATRALIPRAADDPQAEVEYWAGRRRVGVMACSESETYVYLSCPDSDERGCRVPLDADDWAATFPALRALFPRVAAAGGVTRFPYPYVDCRAWSRGRVALIGDAAHALPPTLGQGAGLAVVNAAALVAAVTGARDIAGALHEWEAARRPITQGAQRWSRRFNTLTIRWPDRFPRSRHLVLRCLGAAVVNRRLRAADRVPQLIGAGAAGAGAT